MTSQQRIVTNTVAQYTRTIINVCLSLYSTRLILLSLGQTDYGIYSVVGGVVAMLSFMTNALVTTTQRYLSYYHGQNDRQMVYQVFGNSVLLHLLIGVGLLFVLSLIEYPVVHKLLHIDVGRLNAATVVYYAAVVMLLMAFLTAPFRALFIARENIVYISIVDVLDGVLKLLIAILLTYVMSCDRLILYSLLMIVISVTNLLLFALYALKHFEECHIPRLSEWSSEHIHGLSGFAGWTIYSTGCIMARTQGLAIILNRAYGSAINASYGVAQQVSGAVFVVSQSVLNAMNPQLIKAEGAGNRQRMLMFAELSSKYATLLMSMVVVPLVAEMPDILQLWLKDVPEHSVMFCRFVLIASVCDQLTIGLGTANQAIGNIRNYSLTINTIKVLTLPAVWLCLLSGLPIESVMWCYLGIELICALTRLPFLKKTANLNMWHFVKNVFIRSFFSIAFMVIVCYCMVRMIDLPYRFVLTILISIFVGMIMIWTTALQKDEKEVLRTAVLRRNNK